MVKAAVPLVRAPISSQRGAPSANGLAPKSSPTVNRPPLTVVADTANGMGGLVVPRVFAGLPFELEILYGDLDGTFPNHPADPIQPENLKDLQGRVLETGGNPVLLTGTGNTELNRYLNLINSTGHTSASGLKAGGVLVAN